MAIFPSSIASLANLYRAANNVVSQLNGGIDDTTLTITVQDGSAFVTPCLVTIGNAEVVEIASKSGNVLTASARGFDGTSGIAHAHGSYIKVCATAAHHNNVADEVIAIQTALGTNLSNVIPIARHYSMTYASLTATATTQTISTTIQLSQYERVTGLCLKQSTAFTGGSVAAVMCSVGVSGDVAAFSGGSHVVSDTASDTAFLEVGGLYKRTSMGISPVTVALGFESVGANLSTLTAGALDLWVQVSRLQ